MILFGVDTSDPVGLQKALAKAEQAINTTNTMVRDSENRMYGIIRGAFDGAYIAIEDGKITLHLAPVPKAEPV